MKADEEPNKYCLPGLEELAPLQSFDPKVFLDDDKPTQNVCNFVLSLAVVYNDLKDLLWVHYHLGRSKPKKNEKITRYLGEHAGLRLHASKLLFSILNELIQLLRENQTLLEDGLFKNCVSKLPREARDCWDGLVALSTGNKVEHQTMKQIFRAIRNKVSFHYCDLNAINLGFRLQFTDQIRPVENKTPYVSLGKNAMESRFYFADALIQAYVEHKIGNESLVEFGIKFSKLTEEVNFALRFLIEHFIYNRRGALRKEQEQFAEG